MGAFFALSSGSKTSIQIAGNPDPSKYDVIATILRKGYTIAWLRYEGCTNYEGQKIVVLKGNWLNHFDLRKPFDPHFIAGGSLIARFVPSYKGLDMASDFVNNLN